MHRNSFLFREVNQRIRDVSASWIDTSEPVGFLCECGDRDCIDVLELGVADYEAIRSVPNRFLVRQGHELPDVDDVVARVNGYVIVEKQTSDRLL